MNGSLLIRFLGRLTESIINVIKAFKGTSGNALLILQDVSRDIITLIGKTFYNLSVGFSNRELAVGFWIVVFIILALSKKEVRNQIPGLLKSIFSRHLFIWYISMSIYFFIMLLILIKIGFWETSVYDTLLVSQKHGQ